MSASTSLVALLRFQVSTFLASLAMHSPLRQNAGSLPLLTTMSRDTHADVTLPVPREGIN